MGGLLGDDLRGAILQRANLKDAYLTGANLERAYLLGADLSGAHLEGTNLERARNLTQMQLDKACGNAYTKLPEGFEALRPCRAP